MRHITYQFMEQHDFGPFFTIPAIYQYLEGVKNGSFFRSKSSNYGRLVAGQGTQLENNLVRHITSQYMGQHDFAPFLSPPAIFPWLEVVKMTPFVGQNQVVMAGQFQAREPKDVMKGASPFLFFSVMRRYRTNVSE